MTEAELRELAETAARLLQPHLRRSEAVRRVAFLAGQWLVEQAQQTENDISLRVDAPPAPETQDGLDAQSSAVAATAPLRIGDAVADVAVHGTADEIAQARTAAERAGGSDESGPSPITDAMEPSVDPELIESRCAMKAESCRLFTQRERAADEQEYALLTEKIKDLLVRAKQMQRCFLWVLFRERAQPPPPVVERIADCYDALGESVAVARRCRDRPSPAEIRVESLELVAHAVSALRVAMRDSWLTSPPDTDQDEAYQWLKERTLEEGVFLPRYMRLDDPADPTDAPAVLAQARELGARIADLAQREKEIESKLNRIRYHSDKLADGDPDDHAAHVDRITISVGELVALGVPASDRRVTEAVGLRAAARFDPDDVRGHVAATLRALDERAEPRQAGNHATGRREWSTAVHELRQAIRGRTVVIIGGEPRPQQARAIEEAFECTVLWPTISEHGSGQPMHAPIARAETALVLVLVKLAGHLHVEEARLSAARAGVPVVMLPAGFNPEQIADAIGRQVSQQLPTSA